MKVTNKLGIIYLATSPIGKHYVGQTRLSLEERKNNHKWKSNNPSYSIYNSKFSIAIREFGFDSFKWSILEKDIEDSMCNSKEIEWIKYFDSFENGYNSTLGGDTKSGWKASLLTKEKISKGNTGKIRSPEMIQRMSEIKKGIAMKEETKQKISNALKGKPKSEQHKLNIKLNHRDNK